MSLGWKVSSGLLATSLMMPIPPAKPIDLALSPEEVWAQWPGNRALAAAWSGHDLQSPGRSRWTILAEPTTGTEPGSLLPDVAGQISAARDPDVPPFCGGWIGFVGYELGKVLEPAAGARGESRNDRPWPRAYWARCPWALVHDRLLDQWWRVGQGGPEDIVAYLLAGPRQEGFALGEPVSRTGRERFVQDVNRIKDYIGAGDVFQVNLTHRLASGFGGSSRALFGRLAMSSLPWFGGYVELGERSSRKAVCSVSPELFLSFDPITRRVTTRPMKGTRPGGADPDELRDAEKDKAELNMIIDLMRNDLGRVCEFGSIQVEQPREIERHGGESGGVLQGVATVSGVLRESHGVEDLLRATFPAGSVTGAPKIRAMQIIEELEPVERGPYCGAFGFISDCGHAAFNVAIRTALISGGLEAGCGQRDLFADATLDYHVGAGIVADSIAEAEWDETMDKARALLALARRADCVQSASS